MIEKEEIERIHRETGFDRDLLEKVYNMSQILSGLEKNEFLLDVLALKGGTSLNLLYLDIPRLSIDLDFDFIGVLDREKMLKERKAIEKTIKELGNGLGYEVEDRGSSYIISRYIFRYVRSTGTKDQVKIEVNFLQRMPIMKIEAYEFQSIFPHIDPFIVPTYKIEELCAQKIVACLDRHLPRDIFDIYSYSLLDLDIELTRKLFTVYFCMSSNTKIPDLSFFDELDPGDFVHNLRQFVRNGSEYDPALIMKESKVFLKKILDLSDKSMEFIDDFFDGHTIRSSLLFPRGTDLSMHPSLIFKLSQLEKERT